MDAGGLWASQSGIAAIYYHCALFCLHPINSCRCSSTRGKKDDWEQTIFGWLSDLDCSLLQVFMLCWGDCPWVTVLGRNYHCLRLTVALVLFNGLGSHITMIPAKNVLVYLQVSNVIPRVGYLHWLWLDRILEQLCVYWLHRLYQVFHLGTLQEIVCNSIHEPCGKRNVWICVSLGRRRLCCWCSDLHSRK